LVPTRIDDHRHNAERAFPATPRLWRVVPQRTPGLYDAYQFQKGLRRVFAFGKEGLYKHVTSCDSITTETTSPPSSPSPSASPQEKRFKDGRTEILPSGTETFHVEYCVRQRPKRQPAHHTTLHSRYHGISR
jgi:hypothetical protein